MHVRARQSTAGDKDRERGSQESPLPEGQRRTQHAKGRVRRKGGPRMKPSLAERRQERIPEPPISFLGPCRKGWKKGDCRNQACKSHTRQRKPGHETCKKQEGTPEPPMSLLGSHYSCCQAQHGLHTPQHGPQGAQQPQFQSVGKGNKNRKSLAIGPR